MRVWILEDTPEYETGTRHGVYASPTLAWDDLFDQVKKHVFDREVRFSLYVGADQSADSQDATRPIVLVVNYQWGDLVTLSGEWVRGTPGDAPSLAEWRDLQQVGSLLRQHAVQVAGYECTDEQPERTETGKWKFRHAG